MATMSIKELKRQLKPLCSEAQINACVEKEDLVELLSSVSPHMEPSSWEWGSGEKKPATAPEKRPREPEPIKPEGKGFDLLQKMGWKQGQGLGKNEEGVPVPIEVTIRKNRMGLGAESLAPPEAKASQSAHWEETEETPEVLDPLSEAFELNEPPPKAKKLNSQDAPLSKEARLVQQLKGKAPHIKDIVRFG